MIHKAPTVKLISATLNAEALIARAYGICTDKAVPVANIPRWIKAGHESPLEHASATFEIACSRVASHELVRHRLASFSQRSQRYVDESDLQCYMPTNEQRTLMFDALSTAWETYLQLVDNGVPKQLARYVLPNACMTELIVTANFREWRHIIKLRTSPRAQPEMQEIARTIQSLLVAQAPNVFGDLTNMDNISST
jgi:thymidylate synthase (FAD)